VAFALGPPTANPTGMVPKSAFAPLGKVMPTVSINLASVRRCDATKMLYSRFGAPKPYLPTSITWLMGTKIGHQIIIHIPLIFQLLPYRVEARLKYFVLSLSFITRAPQFIEDHKPL